VLNLPIEPLWVRTQQQQEQPSQQPPPPRGRVAFRAAVSEKLLPRLEAFDPDLLLLSAGFDGAAGDEGNAQDEVGGLDLSSDDFRWVTARLCAAVGPRCPIVSVLEGGYGAWDHDESSYDRSCLVQGCAAHVQALVAHSRSMRRTSKRAK
jgi:acetoin utilization deacetylase AcuC-like enzyme